MWETKFDTHTKQQEQKGTRSLHLATSLEPHLKLWRHFTKSQSISLPAWLPLFVPFGKYALYVTGCFKLRSERCNGGWSAVTVNAMCYGICYFSRTVSVPVGWNCHKLPKSAYTFIRWRSVCTLLKLKSGLQNRGPVCHSLYRSYEKILGAFRKIAKSAC